MLAVEIVSPCPFPAFLPLSYQGAATATEAFGKQSSKILCLMGDRVTSWEPAAQQLRGGLQFLSQLLTRNFARRVRIFRSGCMFFTIRKRGNDRKTPSEKKRTQGKKRAPKCNCTGMPVGWSLFEPQHEPNSGQWGSICEVEIQNFIPAAQVLQ